MITYMLDTCTCSFIMRVHPVSVLQRMQEEIEKKNRLVISAITYAEMRYGQIGKKASPKHKVLIDGFMSRIDATLPWGQDAVDETIKIKIALSAVGTPIGDNDTAIAGHAIASKCVLVTNNVNEFKRVPGLVYEDWVI